MNRLERIVEKAERAARRQDKELLKTLVEVLRTSERNLVRRVNDLYSAELGLVQDASHLYKEGRARSLLEQLSTYLSAIENTRLGLNSNDLAQAHGLAFENATEMMSLYDNIQFFKPTIPFDAVELQLKNGAARLKRHSQEAIQKINTAVVDGLVQGRSARVVTREIQKSTGYLRHRAETIALTELGSARADARDRFYEEQGVDYTQRFVTLDERTCPVCAPRHGEVTLRSETLEKLHPRCRCYLAPIRKDWLEAGLVDMSAFENERADLLRGLEQRGIKPNNGKAPFERQRAIIQSIEDIS